MGFSVMVYTPHGEKEGDEGEEKVEEKEEEEAVLPGS